MNCYLLPKGLCEDLQQLCVQFFWGDLEDKKKIHWRSWDSMSLTKAEGGMGFKNLYAHNHAILANQGWRLITNPNSLISKLFKAIYFPESSFRDASIGETPYAWRSIMAARTILQAGMIWKVGDGSSISIWEDNWIAKYPSYAIQAYWNPTVSNVSDLIDQRYDGLEGFFTFFHFSCGSDTPNSLHSN